MRIAPRFPFALLFTLILAACADGPDQLLAPQQLPAADQELPGTAQQSIDLVLHADRPSFSRNTVSFWAVRGETRMASISYADGTPMVTLTIPDGALHRDAQGRRVAHGDSLQITMTLLDRKSYAVRFEPAGLRFDEQEPAVLSFNLARAGRKALESASLSMWRQESPDSPWTLVPSFVDRSAKQLTAHIDGFTVYALSY